jgi:hypothetical protein
MFSEYATSDIDSVVRYPCIVREQGFGASLRSFVFRTRARGSFVVHGSKPEQMASISMRCLALRDPSAKLSRTFKGLDTIGLSYLFGFVDHGYIESYVAAVRSGLSSHTDYPSISRTERQNCSLAVAIAWVQVDRSIDLAPVALLLSTPLIAAAPLTATPICVPNRAHNYMLQAIWFNHNLSFYPYDSAPRSRPINTSLRNPIIWLLAGQLRSNRKIELRRGRSSLKAQS